MSAISMQRMTPAELERVKTLNAVKIPRPQTEAAFVKVMDYYEVCRAGDVPGVFCLSGESGTGKSNLLARVTEEVCKAAPGDLPVLNFTIPERATRKDFVSSMLAGAGDKGAHLGSRTAMEQRLYRLASRLGVELSIGDETNHAVNSDDQLVNFIVGDLGKLISDGMKTGFVFAGTPNFYKMIHSNPQLVGRIHDSFELALFSLDTTEGVAECQEALLEFDVALPFPEFCFMADPVCMAAHMEGCAYSPGKLIRLTRNAGTSAIKANRRRIEADDWRDAFEALRRHSGARNPYRDLKLPDPLAKDR